MASPLEETRLRFGHELQDPEVRRVLKASTLAEVGDNPEAQQAYIESVMNRAAARGSSLLSTVTDTKYYPTSTTSRLNRVPGQEQSNALDSRIASVLGGSNVSNYATGNASGEVGFGGGPQTHSAGGEKFGIEKDTLAWAKSLGSTGKADTSAGKPELTAETEHKPANPVNTYQLDEHGNKYDEDGKPVSDEDAAERAKPVEVKVAEAPEVAQVEAPPPVRYYNAGGQQQVQAAPVMAQRSAAQSQLLPPAPIAPVQPIQPIG